MSLSGSEEALVVLTSNLGNTGGSTFSGKGVGESNSSISVVMDLTLSLLLNLRALNKCEVRVDEFSFVVGDLCSGGNDVSVLDKNLANSGISVLLEVSVDLRNSL